MSHDFPLRQWLLASRPLSWINTAYPFFMSYLLVAGWDLTLVVGTLFFLIPYNFALYGVNDVFDYASDLANPRKGGIEGAVLERTLHRRTLWAAALVCAPFLVFLVMSGRPLSWLVLGFSVAALLAYSVPGLRFKERPFVDSATSSLHFVSPAGYGLVLSGAPLTLETFSVLLAFFFWGCASHAFGAVQDIVPDRKGGIASIATFLGARSTVLGARSTVLGARSTVWLSLALWLLAALCTVPLGWPWMLTGLLAVPYLLAAVPYVRIDDAQSGLAHRGWSRFLLLNYLCGFLLTMAILLSRFSIPAL